MIAIRQQYRKMANASKIKTVLTNYSLNESLLEIEEELLSLEILNIDDIKSLHQKYKDCLLYTSPSPRDLSTSRMPSSA